MVAATAAARAEVLPTLAVKRPFGDISRSNRLLPLILEVTNPGPSISGTLVVRPERGSLSVKRPIDLPTGTKKRAMVYVDGDVYQSEYKVDLMGLRGLLPLRTAEFEVTNLDEPRRVCAMVGNETWGLTTFAKDEARPLTLVNVQPGDVPGRWYGWDMIDAVLWPESSGAPPALDQATALGSWVAMGGTLVISTGGDGRMLGDIAGLLRAPLSAGAPMARTEVLAGLGLEASAGGSEMVPVTSFPIPPRARAMYEAGGRPLLVEIPHGMGRILLFTFDPSIAGIARAGGATDLWARLLDVPTVPSDTQNRFRGAWSRLLGAAESFVKDIPALRPVSLTFLVIFMGAYVIVVGPLDYFVLKKLNRLTLTWVTYPLAIVVFSAIAWGFASAMKGGEMVVTSLQVVDQAAGDPVERRTEVAGVYAVERDTYKLSPPSPAGWVEWIGHRETELGGLWSGNVVRDDDGQSAPVELPINIFTQERVVYRESVPVRDRPLEVTLGEPMPAKKGWRDVLISNRGKTPVKSVCVLFPDGGFVPLGDLAPDATVSLSSLSSIETRNAPSTIQSNLVAGESFQKSPGESPWHVTRADKTIVSVSESAATAMALALTLPGEINPPELATPLSSLGLATRMGSTGVVVLGHTLESGPSSFRIGKEARSCQSLRLWRVVVDGARATGDANKEDS